MILLLVYYCRECFDIVTNLVATFVFYASSSDLRGKKFFYRLVSRHDYVNYSA